MSKALEELRDMAADRDIDSELVLRQGFAIVADIGETVEDIKEKQEKSEKAQIKFNANIHNRVEKNTNTLSRYNKATWLFGSTIAIWGLWELFQLVTNQ